jgi:hypothetical protein
VSLVLTPEPGAPVLLAGDEAVWLLTRSGSTWAAEPGGELPIDDGHIDTAARGFLRPGTSFSPVVDGLTSTEFFRRFVI